MDNTLRKIGTVYMDMVNGNLVFVESDSEGNDIRRNGNLKDISIVSGLGINNKGETSISTNIRYTGSYQIKTNQTESIKQDKKTS